MLRESLNARAYVPTCRETVTLTRMSYAQPTQKELARPYYTFQPGSQEASVVPHHSLATGCGGEPITPSCTALGVHFDAPERTRWPSVWSAVPSHDCRDAKKKKKNPPKPTKSHSVIITKGLDSMWENRWDLPPPHWTFRSGWYKFHELCRILAGLMFAETVRLK